MLKGFNVIVIFIHPKHETIIPIIKNKLFLVEKQIKNRLKIN